MTLTNFSYYSKDVTHVGLKDIPSTMAGQSSLLYANNISKLLQSFAPAPGVKGQFGLDLNDEVVRGSLVLHNGELIWPPPKPPSPPPPKEAAADKKKEKEAAKVKLALKKQQL